MTLENRDNKKGSNSGSDRDIPLKGDNSRREILHKLTQRTRFTLIQNILMHPQRMPSMKELDYVNPDLSRSTIREHLERLEDLGMVRSVSLPQEDVQRDLPRKFFTLTSECEDLLREFNLIDMEDTLEFVYENMEKTDEIKRYEEAPRPDN